MALISNDDKFSNKVNECKKCSSVDYKDETIEGKICFFLQNIYHTSTKVSINLRLKITPERLLISLCHGQGNVKALIVANIKTWYEKSQ